MATIISVHGTFAHLGGVRSEEAAPGVVPQWWQRDSATEAELQQRVQGSEGPIQFAPLVWSGDNSELARREAGHRLLAKMRSLEGQGESYCVVGHSHGGSVISSALLEASARRLPLPGLKRWITVGTPFVSLRKERALFLRLNLVQKAVFVASLMLLLMFAAFVAGEAVSGNVDLGNREWLVRFGIYLALMSLPFAVFWAFFKILDARNLFFYRARTIARAADGFGPRWLGLWHKNDEAVSGLSSIGKLRVQIFHPEFAVPFFSLLSVFLLPLLYLLILMSPGLMVGIAEFMRDEVYKISEYETSEAQVIAARQELRQLRRSLRKARAELDDAETSDNFTKRLDAKKKVESLTELLRDAREKMHAEIPNLVPVQRALRFKRRFLEQDGKACAGGSLCGEGRDLALNSKLLFHLVTDEASSLVLDEDLWRGRLGFLVRLLLPVVAVPIVFGMLAVLLVYLVQGLTGFLSRFLARQLDELTWFEVRRSALGNDTETEVVLTAAPRPPWLREANLPLPSELGDKITAYSNGIAVQSLGKFRNAIGALAFSDGMENKEQTVFDYLTWRELIHSSYFEVPEFRWLIAEAIASCDGFKRNSAFEGSQEVSAAGAWLRSVEKGSA
jgi:hypothetical protein